VIREVIVHVLVNGILRLRVQAAAVIILVVIVLTVPVIVITVIYPLYLIIVNDSMKINTSSIGNSSIGNSFSGIKTRSIGKEVSHHI
jgi:hypothetical protein